MNWLKKEIKFGKKKKENPKVSEDIPKTNFYTASLSEMPKEALNIIYEKKLEEYEHSQDENLQKELAIMWKYLREGSNEQYYEFFESHGISRKVICEQDPSNLEKIKNLLERADQALLDLTPEPQIPEEKQIYDEVKTKIQKDQKRIQDSVLGTLHNIEEEDKFIDSQAKEQLKREEHLQKVQKRKKQIKDEETKTELILNQLEPKVKQKKTPFFKKKIKKVKKGVPDRPIKEEKGKRVDFKMLEKIGFSKKDGYDLKGNELICSECGHYLKAHYIGGENSGCNRCGCLVTVEDIAEQHGEKLRMKGPSQKKQIVEEPEPTVIVPQEVPPEVTKQAQQLKTMTESDFKKSELLLPPNTTIPKEESQNQYIDKDEQCTCDHLRSQHYDNHRFCFNCNCSRFSPYPDEEKK